MQYLLDTNICVFFLRGKLNLNELIEQRGRENCFISEITVLELRYGAENSDHPVKSHQAVDNFCQWTFNNSDFRFHKTLCKGKGTAQKKRDTGA